MTIYVRKQTRVLGKYRVTKEYRVLTVSTMPKLELYYQ